MYTFFLDYKCLCVCEGAEGGGGGGAGLLWVAEMLW